MDAISSWLGAQPPPPPERMAALRDFAETCTQRAEALARDITRSTRKPIALSRAEVTRGLATIRGTIAAAHLLEPRPVALAPGRAEIHQRPIGPALAITPFNFPINLALHKLCPAILAGCPSLWKPSPQAPGVAEAVVEALRCSGIGEDLVRLASLGNDDVAALCADPRVALISFTGSVPVGKRLRALAAGARRVVLELGGNAAVILHRPRDLAAAVRAIAIGACANAGQSCISVQRILIPEGRAEWRDALVSAFLTVPTGDPERDETVCGPVISPAAKTRIVGLLEDLRRAGGRVLCGGTWDGLVLAPTLVEGVAAEHPLVRATEAFAPLATLHPYRDLDHALAIADDTPFGLQTGLYSDDEDAVRRALARLRVGALVVDDVPTRRDDRLPYGGMRDSGVGREGTLATVLDYCEPMVLYHPNAP
jgi:acyl-CoA reductase-like NAD-dependent aldehyde dehydrogenase